MANGREKVKYVSIRGPIGADDNDPEEHLNESEHGKQRQEQHRPRDELNAYHRVEEGAPAPKAKALQWKCRERPHDYGKQTGDAAD